MVAVCAFEIFMSEKIRSSREVSASSSISLLDLFESLPTKTKNTHNYELH